MTVSTGCTRNAVGSSTWQRTLITEVLSIPWLWTFNHNVWKWPGRSSRSCYQFSLPATSQNMWLWVQLLCAPCQWDLATEKPTPPTSATEWQGNDQTDLQCQATRHCHHQVHWATCVAWHWGSGPRSEGEKVPLVWTCGTLQRCSWDSLWHTGWQKAGAWETQDDREAADKRGIAESGSSRLSTFMIDILGDLLWDLTCVQQASYLEAGPLMWLLPQYLHVDQKSNDDDDDLDL